MCTVSTADAHLTENIDLKKLEKIEKSQQKNYNLIFESDIK